MLAQKIDIQDIPFPDNCFDIVIANYMLYHVPDLEKGLSEVKRVLKSGGKFYCATNGTGGMHKFISEAYRQTLKSNAFEEILTSQFCLQNGKDVLYKYFKNVRRVDYEDSLAVTDTNDLMDWIKSSILASEFSENDLKSLYDYFENIRQKEGAINIPKETGMFINEHE
jgi:ubiquinone/menaquinone biosynthesis C-methylase UbiE